VAFLRDGCEGAPVAFQLRLLARMRANVERLKDKVLELVDPEDEGAVRKAEHYLALLDKQIAVADDIEQMIDNLSQPYGVTATKDRFPGLFRDED
jgi:hypothetical protein